MIKYPATGPYGESFSNTDDVLQYLNGRNMDSTKLTDSLGVEYTAVRKTTIKVK